MFAGPEYASYIALCCELRLEREFEEGDWFLLRKVVAGHGGGYTLAKNPSPELFTQSHNQFGADEDHPWLPRLDQWLAMLEEAGWARIGISRIMDQYIAGEIDGLGKAWCRTGIYAPTREEAAARLWLAVGKR